MQIWKWWTDELRTTRKTGSERRQRAKIDTCSAWWRMTVQLPPGNWKLVDLLLQGRSAGERYLPDYVIERYSGLTPGVKVWGAISYHGLTNLLRIEGIPGAIFEQDNARPRVAKTVRDFCSAQHVQLLPWSAYSPDMSPIEHVGDLVGRRLARDPYPAASKNELLLRI
ncbi:transposable element Tcb2 transposase [Trichonephila clavipes]|uniref:Transposable element Tcb2 transposase n=1 Tax=Trichonephila clavipes TaxID=2585209 RepID=A0A8X6VNH3_TRICX|nr:transposable element Tcb2 transposase [Trichonephila clavipes]